MRVAESTPGPIEGGSLLEASIQHTEEPTAALDQLAWLSMLNKKPCYDDLKVFGCLSFVHLNSKPRHKFAPRSRKCIYIRYRYGKKGWNVYYLETNEIFTSRDVVFYEKIFASAKIITHLNE